MYKDIREVDSDLMFEIGERIRKERLNKGLQSKELAISLDMTKDNYSRIENGAQLITTKTLYKVSQILDVSLDYLMFGDTEDSYVAEIRMLFKGKGLDKIRKAVELLRVFFEG